MKAKTLVPAVVLAHALTLAASGARADEPPPAPSSPAPAPSAPPRNEPWSQGKVRVGVGGGATLNLDTTAFQISCGIGYFVVDYLEIGADIAFQFGTDNSPFTFVLGPAARLVVPIDKNVIPYLGAFYHHYFVADSSFADLDAAGMRAGIFLRTSELNIQLGVAWDHILSDCTGDCDIFRPEVGVTFGF